MKKIKKGYTSGVFDLFHIGHLNILKKAKENCDYLIVAISTDELVQSYKSKTPIICFDERKSIVEAIKYVDEVVPQVDRDKKKAFDKYMFDVMFVGDDWKGSKVFKEVNEYMEAKGARVEFFPYTKHTSSTLLTKTLKTITSNERV